MTITQPTAPFHVIPLGWVGPSFLAMLLFEKYGQHPLLNRQADRSAREGVPLSVSTLAHWVGAARYALAPLYRRIETHMLTVRQLHGDDTTVTVMAKGKTHIARLWVYVHDDRPFAGTDPPAALFRYPHDRRRDVHARISPLGWGSCRPKPTAATPSSTRLAGSPACCWRQAVSPMLSADSLN